MPSPKKLHSLLIGPFPHPIHGCSIANQTLLDGLQKLPNIIVSSINTGINDTVSAKQGSTFSFQKALNFLKVYYNLDKVWKADVVYMTPGHTFYGFLKFAPFILICIALNIPYLLHIHGNNLGREFKTLSQGKQRLLSFLSRRAHKGIVLSESLRGNFDGLLSAEKVVVVPNFFNDDLKEVSMKDKHFDQLRLLYLSSLMKEKGILDVLEACKILNSNNIPFELQIAGKETAEDKMTFRGLLKELGGKVNYLGLVSGKSKIDAFTQSNIFILPTYYQMEGQPISIIEAMATANVIVTTNYSGIPDIVNQSHAVFVEPQNPENIAKHLIKLHEELSKVQSIAIGNKEYAQSCFTEDKFIQNIFELLNDVSKSS